MRLLIILFCSTVILLPVVSIGQAKPGRSFHDCAQCPEMMVVPAGHFIMGSPQDEQGRDSIEGFQHTVTIGSFAVGKFHITRAQWEYFLTSTKRPVAMGCAWSGLPGAKPWALNPAASWDHLGFPQDDTHPAICLSWADANDYIAWLSKTTGFVYRLPSEAEWEYAARAGTTTAFPWGKKGSHEYANYGADSGWTGIATGRDKWAGTSPVGSFPPNAFGLYDMPGNVMQYTADCFAASPDQKDSCTSRIIRGGDWGDPPRMLRSAFRNWTPARGSTLANYRSAGLGLRVVRDVK